jgi:Family of unknown function (DUF695)
MNCEWSVHVSEKDGSLQSLRLNEDINDYVCHPKYTTFIGVSVTFKKQLTSGLPVDEEKNVLSELEALLVEQLIDNMLCVLAAVITADGSREFIMYTYAPAQCQKILGVLNETWFHHEIEFTLQEDSEWDVFETLLK